MATETPNTGREDRKVIIPVLPAEASFPEAFAVSGWKLRDSASLDFNEDGLMDFVGVLEYESIEEAHDSGLFYPRVLFAAVNMGNGLYKLDFQDINLIRTRDEGGAFGDPYEPLSVHDNTFTIHAYGGSSWKWSESASFRYIDGGWYLINDITREGYGPFLTYYEKNDYESGIGFRGYNNDSFDCLENIWNNGEVYDNLEEADFDLSFRVETGPPITLSEASQRWWLAPDRLETIQPDSVGVVMGVDIAPSDIPPAIEPYPFGNIRFMDQNYILYTFRTNDKEYLAVYDKNNNSSMVAAQTYSVKGGDYKDNFSNAKIYHDMIYYEELVYANVKSERNGVITEELEHIASRLVRMNPDGSGKETVFEYAFIDENEPIQNWAPYCHLGFSFADKGVLINLYRGDNDTQYYFIEPDGNNARYLGSVRGTSSVWLGDLSLVGRIGDNLNIHMRLSVNDGRVEGGYYYDKYGQEIKLSGYFSRGSLELYEEGGTGTMYGMTIDGAIKGAWTHDTRVLLLVLVMENQQVPEPVQLYTDILTFEGHYNGIQSNEYRGSDITITPLFNDLAYIDVYAFGLTVNSVNIGGFCGLAVFDNNGLNYQANEKKFVFNETIVFRLIKNENGGLVLDTNDIQYSCGAGVGYDTVYIKE